MGYTKAELDAFAGGTLPDTLGPVRRLLFVGINPGLHTVAVQAPFARPGNRFFPALYRAGIVDRVIDASAGWREDDRQHLLARGVGITSIVRGATRRADEVSKADLVAGVARIEALASGFAVVAVLGITAYRVAFGRPDAAAGRQPETIGGSGLWVLPNPSGLNAHETAASLADAYRRAAVAAGIPVFDQPL
jgi:TDG/mug DNA glycosylase family protein